MKKQYITADQLLIDSFELAMKIIDSGFNPDLIVGVWRGGTPVAISVQEVMKYVGIDSDHTAIRTSSYTGIGERTTVKVDGLDYLEKHLHQDSKLLIVDDVFDTGLSIDGIIEGLKERFQDKLPEIRIATPYFKSENNQTKREPDYFLFETSDWLVFPHELVGLNESEITTKKPLPDELIERLIISKKQLLQD